MSMFYIRRSTSKLPIFSMKLKQKHKFEVTDHQQSYKTPIYIKQRRSEHDKARKMAFNQAHGREKDGVVALMRSRMYKSWNSENLLRLYGERFNQRATRRLAKFPSRQRFVFGWHQNSFPGARKKQILWRRQPANEMEWVSYDPIWRAKNEGELGPDAVYKYKPNPHHLKFRHYAIHPRPIESNLVTGNEKTADRILPQNYMDKIFNQSVEADGKIDISDRFELDIPKLHYTKHHYSTFGFKQRLLARLFDISVPHLTEPLSTANWTRRRFIGSNEVWLYGCWVDRRQINDFLTIVTLYLFGLTGIHVTRLRFEAERLHGQLIHIDINISNPATAKHRLIVDSDRNKKPQFELIEPIPRRPLLD